MLAKTIIQNLNIQQPISSPGCPRSSDQLIHNVQGACKFNIWLWWRWKLGRNYLLMWGLLCSLESVFFSVERFYMYIGNIKHSDKPEFQENKHNWSISQNLAQFILKKDIRRYILHIKRENYFKNVHNNILLKKIPKLNSKKTCVVEEVLLCNINH